MQPHFHDNIRLSIQQIPISEIRFSANNPRRHSERQTQMLVASIAEFGMVTPVLLDANNALIAGEARVRAATLSGLTVVPAISITHLTAGQIRAYRIAGNRLAEKAEWNKEVLASELNYLASFDLDFNFDAIGFETAEADILLESVAEATTNADDLPEIAADRLPTSRPGDLWILGDHRVLCGSALDALAYAELLQGRLATMVITDPPYNVKVDGHVSGLGQIKHREFAMASGEMTDSQFVGFLTTCLGHAANNSVDGAIHDIFMDWRHLYQLSIAALRIYSEQKNLCVWNKSNAGMGSLYRSKHEMVAIYKAGTAPHINNIDLGRHGRYRTNVWDYAGVNTFGKDRDAMLAMHPTVKPVALIADAIKDCSRRGDIILDPFGGSGTTFIAAEKTGRVGALIEIDPLYVDVIVDRWQSFTGRKAILAASGQTFEETAVGRVGGQTRLLLTHRASSSCKNEGGCP